MGVINGVKNKAVNIDNIENNKKIKENLKTKRI